jgi:hypothetical protein
MNDAAARRCGFVGALFRGRAPAPLAMTTLLRATRAMQRPWALALLRERGSSIRRSTGTSVVTRSLYATLSNATAFAWLSACNPIIVDAFEAPDAEPPPVNIDRCPDDTIKLEPGVCGCGIPDDDFDRDGVLDCDERCPDNPARIEPMGACGCSGLADENACVELRGALRNLYRFNDRGSDIIDAREGRNGTVLTDEPPADLESLQVNGRLNFDGVGSYVDLPDRILSSLTSATIEAWLIWRGGDDDDLFWQRIFDFGDSEDGAGQSYLFLTPSNSENDAIRAAFSLAGNGAETVLEGVEALPRGAPNGELQHVAVVVDDVAQEMRLYTNGVEVDVDVLVDDLAAVNDVNNWLGRSNFSDDPSFSGSLIEFRIYEQALGVELIRASFEAGPGALDD